MSLSNKRKTVLIALAALVAGASAWQIVKYRLIREKAPVWLSRKTDGLYRIRYGNLHLDEIAGTLEVHNVEISPDSQVYANGLRQGQDPSLLIKASIPILKILGVRTPKALLLKKIEARTIEMDGARVELLVGRSRPAKKAKDPLKEIEAALLSGLTSIHIDSVSLVRSSLFVRRVQETAPRLQLDSLSLSLNGFAVDSVQADDSTRILFSRALKIHCNGFRVASASRKYDLLVEGLGYTSAGDVVSVDRLRWRPRLSEAAFAASFPVATDRYDFSLEDVRLLHLDRRGLLQNIVSADSLVVGRSAFRIYCDVSYPRNRASQNGKFPQQLIMKLPFTFALRKALFADTYIEYKEKNAKSDTAGRLQFFHGRAAISNLTNEKERLSAHDRCLIRYKGRFLNQAPVEIRLDLVLADPHGEFLVEGKLDSLYAPAINPMLQPMGLAKVEKGAIQNFQFTLHGNDLACSGRLTLAYKDASLTFLKWKDDRFVRRLLPSLVMAGVMRHSNPSGNGLPRTVQIRRQREDRDSFISFIWKTLFDGIRQTIAVK